MAIVINGSGTVTGLAVGGLPDGTVDAGTLATDSVTAAKLEVSAITGADLPSGSVLQVVQGQSGTQVETTSNAAFVTSGLSAAITPSSTSSKILVTASTTVVGTASTDTLTALFRGTVSGTNITGDASTKYNSSNSEPSMITNTYLDSPSTTSAQTYTLGIKSSVNNQSSKAQVASTRGTIILIEVAG